LGGGDDPSLCNRDRIILFKELIEDYYDDLLFRGSRNYTNSYNKIKNHILPVFGSININNITNVQIQQFKMKKLKEGYAPSTVETLIGSMSAIFVFSAKISMKFKGNNPAYKVASDLTRVENFRLRYLNSEEIELLIYSYRNYKTPEISQAIILFIKLSLSTAARASTVINIKRRDIDLNTRQVRLYDFKNQSHYVGYLSKTLFQDLDFLKDMEPDYKVLYTTQALIYPTLLYHMRPVYDELFNEGLKKHDRYRFSIHSIRHTVASNLAIQGVSLLKIKHILNHKSIRSTLIYAKLQNKDTFDDLDALYSKKDGSL